MQKAVAKTKFVRMQPRKARLVADLIRGKSVNEALCQLKFCQMKPARIIIKTLQSAVANAEMQFDMRRDDMQLVEVRIDQGPYFKRSKARSRGSQNPVLKRTSHVTVAVGESNEKDKG